MKKLMLSLVLTICMAGAAQADLYTDYVPVFTDLVVQWLDPPETLTWTHNNPYVGDYEAALAGGLITSVTLVIHANVSDAEDDTVGIVFTDSHGGSHALGNLDTGFDCDNIFNLSPSWLGGTQGMQVAATLEYSYSNSGDFWDSAGINYSELRVTGCPVPVPAAFLLGLLGMGAAGLRLRKCV